MHTGLIAVWLPCIETRAWAKIDCAEHGGIVMLYRIGYAVLLAVIAASPAFGQDGLPPEIRHLADIETNEQALITAARRVHQMQVELIEWDRVMAGRLSAQNQPGVAETKTMDTQGRVRLIGMMWQYILARYPQNPIANNYYGEYLYDYADKSLDALQAWRLATQYDPKYAHPYNNLGLHYFHTGQLDRGHDNLEKALKLEPDNPDFLYNMSQMYLIYFPQLGETLKMSKDKLFKKAMEMSKKATELLPGDFDLAQDYANNFYAAEQYGVASDWTAAAKAWHRALPLARTEEERFYTLLNEGRTLLRAGQSQEALAAFERAKTMRPESEAVRTLIERAGSGSGVS